MCPWPEIAASQTAALPATCTRQPLVFCATPSMTYNGAMYTIIETPTFAADARDIWTDEERSAFFAWLAANPEAGDVIPGSGGCRKVRWSIAGAGKRGGVRIIYFTRLPSGVIWLLVIYKKAVMENIPAHILKSIREVLENE